MTRATQNTVTIALCREKYFTVIWLTTVNLLCVLKVLDSLDYSFSFRSRKALPMTETELRLIAAPAMIG